MESCTTERTGILAAGNWIVDHVKLIDAYPDQDALAFISGQSSANGGGPFNVLKDLAKLGAEFPLEGAGLVGDDADGQWILADCAAHGIDTRGLRRTERAPTSYTDVMSVEGSGRRTFFHQTGANALLDVGDIDFSASRARYFYLGYLLLLETLDRVAGGAGTGAAALLGKARGAGFETVVDLVSAQEGEFRGVVTPSLPETDILFLNEFEAGSLLGREIAAEDAGAIMAAGADVLGLGVRRCVVVHSAAGAVAVARSGERAAQGFGAHAAGGDPGRGGSGRCLRRRGDLGAPSRDPAGGVSVLGRV